MTAELQAKIDTLEAEVTRLREALKKDPNTMMIAYESGDHMRLVRAVSARDETLKKIVTLAADHLPEMLESYSSAPVSRPQAKEDVVERATKAVKNWCILHSAYIFTDEKARELAKTIVTASGLLSTERERGLEK